jgi:hypothetical protein
MEDGGREAALHIMQRELLEALRHREQEILRYLALLLTAVGGFLWLMTGERKDNPLVFFVGTMGVVLLLFLGALYALALGYNYRYLTLQLAKLESRLKIGDAILVGWPRNKAAFSKRYGKRCYPPGIIKIFWAAFVTGIPVVTVIAVLLLLAGAAHSLVSVGHGAVAEAAWKALFGLAAAEILLVIGVVCFVLALDAPIWYGNKMSILLSEEPDTW